MFKNKKIFHHIAAKHFHHIETNLAPYQELLTQIARCPYPAYSNQQLQATAQSLKERAAAGVSLDALLVEAFGLVREAARRTLKMKPYDVQVMAGIGLHWGKVAEMKTGEGKTLAAVLPAYLNALTGKGVHVLTFNDYLAQRDAEWMKPLYDFLGVQVCAVQEGMGIEERQRAYHADITYVTAKEAGFDYLRDSIAYDSAQLVQRPFFYAIVDEADSILIDEARIPLVIAGNAFDSAQNPAALNELAGSLLEDLDYEVDWQEKNVYLSEAGLEKLEKALQCGNLYDGKNLDLLSRLHTSLHALLFLKRDRDYLVRDGQIHLIDEFTGRIAPGRHWLHQLHAAVEAKEGLTCHSGGRILGSLPIQYFVKLYPKLCGMTGTASSAATELLEVYGLEVVVFPTHRPQQRIDLPDRIFETASEKASALLAEIKSVHQTGQPILIGTGSVAESESLAGQLARLNIPCQVLNARNDFEEASMIAQAGKLNQVTVSTNMAGRGVDIKLGGSQEEERDRIIDLGGLFVLGTQRNESRRIDDQLRGRAGRQGDPGISSFFLSLEDPFIRQYGPELLPPHLLDPPDKERKDSQRISKAIERGQRILEGFHSDNRRQLYNYTYLIEQQRQLVWKKRRVILTGQQLPDLLAKKAACRYAELSARLGVPLLERIERHLTLYYLDQGWADYLDHMAYVKEGIHLVVIGRENPLHEFHKLAIEAFQKMEQAVEKNILDAFEKAAVTERGLDLDQAGLNAPSATWTYLVSDQADQFSRLPQLVKAFKTTVSGTLFSLRSLLSTFAGRFKNL